MLKAAEELRAILAEYAPNMLHVLNACWVNGDTCPYGNPNGRFEDRPKQFCHLGEGGCPVFQEVIEDQDFCSDFVENRLLSQKIDEIVTKKSLALAEEIEEAAGYVEPLEGATLKFAAKIIESYPGVNKKILRAEDFG